MTDEEKDYLRGRKKEVTEQLSRLSVVDYMLEEVDSRLQEYVEGVILHPADHNLFEQLAVQRFFMMVERYGLNVTAVRQFCTFYEQLYFSGQRGMQTYSLTPVQYFQFTSIFGFWREDGTRVVREAVLFVPRKFSKTTSTAALAIYDVLFGEANAEAYCGANSSDQAKKCFDVIRGCFFHLDPKMKRYQINEQVVKSKRKDRKAFAQCLTANARTKDGLNASTVIMDEYSNAQDSDLLTVLTTSMGIRKNPLTVIITTASDKLNAPFFQALEGYKAVLLGDYDDDSLFAHIFEPDVDDEEGDPHTWYKVHPHLGITVTMEFYRQEWMKAQRDAAQRLAFRTKLLNVFAENEQKSWISATLARSIMIPFRLEDLQDRPDAMCAIDLSESDDFSAVTVGVYLDETSSFIFHTAYFFPRGALEGHPNESMYRSWAERGHLILLDGDVIDYKRIVDYILQANSFARILNIGYDAWKSTELINMLGATGASSVLKPVKQTYGEFTAPVGSFEHHVKTGGVRINDNPINAYCFGNAILDEDTLENCKPVKRAKYSKIDGVITMLMCYRLFMDYER